ncbi:putative Myosin heavy chain-like protein [Melia azedarach]|uniref:Myosin heavy chain-like protein n=1 Tax=Melia azedarach TaxID=155640 RepID=A0ACC1WWS3_MELAZ|nr:putative Myosin heavy chain-like protein [Melia azedarach]
MAGNLIFFSLILFSVSTRTSQNQQHDADDNRRLIAELQESKLRIARLEFLLEESVQKINAKSNYTEEREKLIDDLMHKIHDLQSVLSKFKEDSYRAEGRLAALEEEIRLLWAASRKNNFDIHNLKSKAQESEDRLEEVTSEVEKMSEIVTEQWIQIQHLEQALHMAELRAMKIQRQLSFTRCTFLKFVNDLSGKHIPKLFGMLDLSSKSAALSTYISQAVQQFKRLFLAFKKFHHELQGFIKEEMVKNELTAALANEELVFFVASALITFPILAAWMLLSVQFS